MQDRVTRTGSVQSRLGTCPAWSDSVGCLGSITVQPDYAGFAFWYSPSWFALIRPLDERHWGNTVRKAGIIIALLLAAVLVLPALAQSPRNLIINFDMGNGFDPYDGGEIGKGWTPFKLSGSLSYRDTALLSPGFTEKISGTTSQTLWSDGFAFVAGMYQTRGVNPGTVYKAWFATAAKIKGGTMERTIGLDPTGGTDPTASTVVWGSSYGGEKWATIEQGNAPVVRVPATSSKMTVFIKVANSGGAPNQAYIDSIWLVEDGQASSTELAPASSNQPGGGTQTNPQQAGPTPTAVPPAPRPAGGAGKDDYAVDGGWFYSQANGQDAGGDYGYVVSDSDGVPFWTAFQRYGGVNAVGYPVSHRFTWEGFISQAFQKVVFQFRPDQGGAVMFVNVFDQLSRYGKDDWLLNVRNVPKSSDWSVDDGKDWPTVVANHQKLLDPYPAIKSAYFSSPDPVTFAGLPMGVQEFSNVIVVRAQRLVFQQWKEDVPWAKKGQVVVANGGDVTKESGILPAEITRPQPWNYKPASLVTVPPPGQVQPTVTATPTPITAAPTATPVPGAGPYSVESVSYLPNCGLTQLKVYVKDSHGNPINNLIARIEWADQKLDSNPTGKPGSYDPGWTDILLNTRPVANTWKVSLWDGQNRVAAPVEVTTTAECRGDGARQIITVIFKKTS